MLNGKLKVIRAKVVLAENNTLIDYVQDVDDLLERDGFVTIREVKYRIIKRGQELENNYETDVDLIFC